MNELQRSRLDSFGADVWETVDRLDDLAAMVVSEAVLSDEYTVRASPTVKLDPDLILAECHHTPHVREFKHDVHVADREEMTVFIWATDEKRDMVWGEAKEEVRYRRFPNRLGGVSIGSTIVLRYDVDGLVDRTVSFTITEWLNQHRDDV